MLVIATNLFLLIQFKKWYFRQLEVSLLNSVAVAVFTVFDTLPNEDVIGVKGICL